MVLDDVLVNFDAERAPARAAKVLRDFAASGYQVLMFTCHDHFRDLFFDLDADVRVLPHHKEVVRAHAVPTPFEGTKRTLEFVADEDSEVVEIEPEEFGDIPPRRMDLTRQRSGAGTSIRNLGGQFRRATRKATARSLGVHFGRPRNCNRIIRKRSVMGLPFPPADGLSVSVPIAVATLVVAQACRRQSYFFLSSSSVSTLIFASSSFNFERISEPESFASPCCSGIAA